MSDELPTSIRLSKELKADLQKFAKAQGTSITWLITHICTQWVDWRKQQEKNAKASEHEAEQTHERSSKRS